MSGSLQAVPANKEESVAGFVPYSSHVTDSVIKLHSGDYITVLRLQGSAHDSADAVDLNVWHEQLNGFLRNIASQHVSLWSHVVRREYGAFPGGEFEAGFCHDFNDKYRKAVQDERMLINELYLTVVYRPEVMKSAKWFDLFGGGSEQDKEEEQNDALEVIGELVNTALSSLSRYEPEVLGCYEEAGRVYSRALSFLGFLLNSVWEKIPLPRAEISEVLPSSRPFFGKGGLMSLMTPAATHYGAMLGIQEYPSSSYSGILDDLLSAPFELIVSQSFTFLSKPASVGRLTRQQARLVNAGDAAVSQVAEIHEALDDLTSNQFVMGAHSLGIFIRADGAKQLNEYVSEAGAMLADSGMKWAREDMGLTGAFFAMLPGNFEYRVRLGDITSRNFAGFSPLHNFPIGRIDGNQWGDAVTLFKTTSGAPYYFNFHKGDPTAKFDPNHKDLANTVVFGKSGTGKTVLEMMLLAQLQKFNQPEQGKRLSCVVFDKDLGASVGVQAMGGRYYPLKNGMPSGFNPFHLESTPNNMTFLEALVKTLVRHDSLPITPTQEREISQAIIGVMGVPRDKRRLSALLEFFNSTDEDGLYPRLAKWCQGGKLAWLFDNASDSLVIDDTPIIGFDVTEFLDNPETRTPTIMYLFHRIESLIDGRRIPIFMDEFWKLLDDPAFEELAQNKLVTIRKQDGFLVMFTQSPQQVLKSPIAYAIIEQTATKIFLPNPEASREDYVDGLKLSEREYEIVKSLGEKSRQFLIKQGQNSVVAELNLRGFNDELAVLSGNTATAKLAEELIAELGDDPEYWLPEFHRRRVMDA